MENVGEHADLLVLYAVSCGVSSSSVTYTRAQVRMNSTVSVCALLKRQRQTQQGRGGEGWVGRGNRSQRRQRNQVM